MSPTEREIEERVEELETEEERGTPESMDELDEADIWAGLMHLATPDAEPSERERLELRRWYAMENNIDLGVLTEREIKEIDRTVKKEAEGGGFDPF